MFWHVDQATERRPQRLLSPGHAPCPWSRGQWSKACQSLSRPHDGSSWEPQSQSPRGPLSPDRAGFMGLTRGSASSPWGIIQEGWPEPHAPGAGPGLQRGGGAGLGPPCSAGLGPPGVESRWAASQLAPRPSLQGSLILRRSDPECQGHAAHGQVQRWPEGGNALPSWIQQGTAASHHGSKSSARKSLMR